MQRYFAVDKDLNISDKDKHHIINVMRMKVGNKFQIVYNEKLYTCAIKNIEKRNVEYEIIDTEELKDKKKYKVILDC